MNKYLKETASEMRHVSWPSRRQGILYTVLVIAISIVVASYIGALDTLFLKILNIFITN